MSLAFDRAWAKTHAIEQGYSNNPKDPGGETNHGITLRVARAHGYLGDMKHLPVEIAVQIAKTEYWDSLMLDQISLISDRVAEELFDTNFNMWSGAAGKFLQRALNALNREGLDYSDLSVDGNIGPKTVAAFQAFLNKRGALGEVVMLRCLNFQQGADYLRQCTETNGKEEFFYGWVLNRVAI